MQSPDTVADTTEHMTPELYTIIAVGISLAGLILNGQRSLTQLRRELGEVRNQVGILSDQTNKKISSLRDDLMQENAALRERMAHLEGVLKGLREAIVGRAA